MTSHVLDVVAREVVLRIDGDRATVKEEGDDVVEQFNLKDMSWLNSDTGNWVTLAQCQAWAKQAKTDAEKNEDPEFSHAFWLWSLDPVFEVERKGDVLRLKSDHVEYVVDGAGPRAEFDKYYRYLFLNAYKKAILDKKPPPLYELKAISEMVKLGRIPKSYTVTRQMAAQKVVVKVEITENKL